MRRVHKKRKRSVMNDEDRAVFRRLENISPLEYRSARWWVMAMIDAEPSMTQTVYESLVGLWGLTGKFGYGRSPWSLAVKQWRESNGYPPLGKGRPHIRRPANWVDGVTVAEPEFRYEDVKASDWEPRLFARDLNETERVLFGRLVKSVDPSRYTSASSWIIGLMDSEPTVTKNVFGALVIAHGLRGMGGYSDNAWYNSLVRWRNSNGLGRIGGCRPEGMSFGSTPANIPGDGTDYLASRGVGPSQPDKDRVSVSTEAPAAITSMIDVLEAGVCMDSSGNTRQYGERSDESGRQVADMVMDWMDRNGFCTVTFNGNGSVKALRPSRHKREITVSVQETVH